MEVKRTIAGKEYIGPPKERWIAGEEMDNAGNQDLYRGLLKQSQVIGRYQANVNLFNPNHKYRIYDNSFLTQQPFSKVVENNLTVIGLLIKNSLKWELFGFLKMKGLQKITNYLLTQQSKTRKWSHGE